MSVLCCQLPDFLVELACRQQAGWRDRPLALVGPDERIWAAAPSALRTGVTPGMRPPQALLCCPELLLHPLDVAASQAEQNALLALLAEWQLPVEVQGWGMAYVDLHAVARSAEAVRPLAVELGQRVRAHFGGALQPALGWDSGKFTARAAALQTAAGRLRLVDKADEVRFLAPLPIALLPLPRPHLQQLHWLGIRTLGQFAALPAAAVWQRFGAAGKLAQQWAQGRDERPVRAGLYTAPEPTVLALDPPTNLLQPVVGGVLNTLQPALARWAKQLEGLCQLRLVLGFLNGEERTLDLAFVEPASQPARVQAALVQQLSHLSWPAPLERVRWWALATGELPAHQLSLFADPPERLVSLAAVAQKLSPRHGSIFFRSALTDAHHPVPERRAALTTSG